MNVISPDTMAVPDSSFPFGNELESLAGLLEPQASLEECAAAIGLKLGSLQQGDDGSSANFYPPPYGPGMYGECLCLSRPLVSYLSPLFPEYCGLDADWMCQNTLLPTPQEQETDVGTFLPPLAPYANFHSVLTPDSSLPSSPTSSQYQADVLNVLSLISPNPDSQLNQSTDILPQFDGYSPLSSPASYNPSPVTYSSSPAGYDFTSTSYDPTPAGTLLPSPLPPSSQEFSPVATYPYAMPPADSPSSSPFSENANSEGIRDLLARTENTPPPTVSNTCKRNAATSTDSSEGAVKGKRRKLTKVAKKERKKEQNKQAALRYRQRKRGETEEVDSKREELEAINTALKSQVNSLMAEINYLKKLRNEIEAARGKSLEEQSKLQ